MLLQNGFRSRDVREQVTADLSASDDGGLDKMEEVVLTRRAQILRKCEGLQSTGFPDGLDVAEKGHSEGKQRLRDDS